MESRHCGQALSCPQCLDFMFAPGFWAGVSYSYGNLLRRLTIIFKYSLVLAHTQLICIILKRVLFFSLFYIFRASLNHCIVLLRHSHIFI